MKIGLVDIDGCNNRKKGGATYPNLALCKLARHHRQQGDTVEFADAFVRYDILYMAKVFSFTPDDLTCWQADRIVKGGTGYDITSRLPEHIDRLQPDYSIYPAIPSDTAYGFLTRGCPNKCPWCVVPRKEGKIRPYMDVDEIAIEGRHKLVLMDNNILAAGDYAVEQLTKIIERGYRVDFNQALDARLVDDRFARLLAQVKWLQRRIRFGCDTHKQIEDCERAMALINSHGYRGEYFLYTMLNDNFEECYSRLTYWWQRNQEQRIKHYNYIYPYAQPYRDPDNPSQQVPQWQKDMAAWVNKHQIFQMTDFAGFSPRRGFRCSEYLEDPDKLK